MADMKDGGPAFPWDFACQADHPGMSLRDYFAAKALSGIAALPDSDALTVDKAARLAYRYAEEMLKERAK